MSVRHARLAPSVVFGAAAWLAPACLAIVLTPPLVRGLGTAGFGLYAFLTAFLAVTFTSGIGRAFLQRASGDAGREEAAAWFGTALRLAMRVGAAGGLGAAGLVALAWSGVAAPGDGAAGPHAAAVALAFLAAAVFQVVVVLPLATFRFGDYNAAVVAVSVLTLAGGALLARAGAGPAAVVLWVAAANVLTAAFVLVRARGTFDVAAALSGRDPRPVAGFAAFGGAVLVYQVCGALQLLFERWWIGRALGLDSVAFYAVATTLAQQVHTGVAAMARGLLPAASAARRGAGGAAEVERLYGRALGTLVPPLAVVVATLAALRVEILTVWMGPTFAARAGDALGLLAASFGILALLIVPWEFLEAKGAPAGNALFGASWLVAGVAVDLAAVPRWGVAGAALGRLTLAALAPFYVAFVERRLFGAVRGRLWASVGVLSAGFGAAAVAAARLVPPLAGGGVVGLAAALGTCGTVAALAAYAGRSSGLRRA